MTASLRLTTEDASCLSFGVARAPAALVGDGHRSTEADLDQDILAFGRQKPSGRHIAREPLEAELCLSSLSSFARQQALGPSQRARAARGCALAFARSLGGVGQPLQLLEQRGLGARQQVDSRQDATARRAPLVLVVWQNQQLVAERQRDDALRQGRRPAEVSWSRLQAQQQHWATAHEQEQQAAGAGAGAPAEHCRSSCCAAAASSCTSTSVSERQRGFKRSSSTGGRTSRSSRQQEQEQEHVRSRSSCCAAAASS
jgi:hypothetical protein